MPLETKLTQNVIAVLDTKMSVQTINQNRNFVIGSFKYPKCSDFHVGDIDASIKFPVST